MQAPVPVSSYYIWNDGSFYKHKAQHVKSQAFDYAWCGRKCEFVSSIFNHTRWVVWHFTTILAPSETPATLLTTSRWSYYGLSCFFCIEDVSAFFHNIHLRLYLLKIWLLLFNDFLCFHSDSLVPVKTVQLGEPAALTCMSFNEQLSTREVHWYKQSPGDTLKLIVTLWKSTGPDYAPEYSKSRVEVQFNNSFSNLTILRVSQEDEGMYHCAVTEWIKTNWRATYLLVKGIQAKSH